jgi:hypothetical protein
LQGFREHAGLLGRDPAWPLEDLLGARGCGLRDGASYEWPLSSSGFVNHRSANGSSLNGGTST